MREVVRREIQEAEDAREVDEKRRAEERYLIDVVAAEQRDIPAELAENVVPGGLVLDSRLAVPLRDLGMNALELFVGFLKN